MNLRIVDFGLSNTYKKKRAADKKQTSIKDLQFTGQLFRDFRRGVSDSNEIVIGFTSDRSNDIRIYQETSDKQIMEEIFYPNEKEMDLGLDEFNKVIDSCIVK